MAAKIKVFLQPVQVIKISFADMLQRNSNNCDKFIYLTNLTQLTGKTTELS